MLNRQKFLNEAYAAIIAQGKASFIIGGAGILICQYRGPNGLKCAIGHLIPDDGYSTIMEMNRVSNPRVLSALGLDNIFEDDIEFLCALQSSHDLATWDDNRRPVGDEEFIEEFKWQIERLSERYDLQVPA